MRSLTLTMQLENGATVTKTTIILNHRELDTLIEREILLTHPDSPDAMAILLAEDEEAMMHHITTLARQTYDLSDDDVWTLDHRPLDEQEGGSGGG